MLDLLTGWWPIRGLPVSDWQLCVAGIREGHLPRKRGFNIHWRKSERVSHTGVKGSEDNILFAKVTDVNC